MTPSARIQAAIEVLDLVIAAARGQGASADRLLGDWLRTRRFIGSKDRRAIRELVYAAIRACGEVPVSGRAAMLRYAGEDPAVLGLFDGAKYGPAPVDPGEPVAEGGVAPRWLVERLEASGVGAEAQAALLDRAPLDLRANRLKITREALAARPGESVIDLCAGAGGKTLALAAAMDNRGTLLACDVDRGRLGKLAPRAERAGAIVETRLLDGGREAEQMADWQGRADAVLIDAPCSGTGTWRRNPEARWRLDAKAIDRFAATQAKLLRLGAGLVRPGGRLAYVVCSLLDAEGADIVGAFLSEHPDWTAAPLETPPGTPRGAGVRLDPARDGTDGFFFATLRRL